jgi:hypothetical protein
MGRGRRTPFQSTLPGWQQARSPQRPRERRGKDTELSCTQVGHLDILVTQEARPPIAQSGGFEPEEEIKAFLWNHIFFLGSFTLKSLGGLIVLQVQECETYWY